MADIRSSLTAAAGAVAAVPAAVLRWAPDLAALAGWLEGEDLDDAMREHLDKLLRRELISEAEARAVADAFDLPL